jgi:23S rRNA pseudouridine1911/1915/1917 synthase
MKNQNLNTFCHQIIVPEELKGCRLDQALAKLFPQYSRTRLQHWIKSGQVTIDHQITHNRYKCEGGENIQIEAEPEKETGWEANTSDLTHLIVYEDSDIIILNKPIGLVVHPGAGNNTHTLANQLLNYYPPIQTVPRAGIVHRLDKNTSGLLIIAKTLPSQIALTKMLAARKVHREYWALTTGVMISGGTINAPLGRHKVDRQKMAVTATVGKEAITHFRVLERFRSHTLVKVMLETGRTHQIRVHLAHKHFPILGDSLYGAKKIIPPMANETLKEAIRECHHQMLHAKRLAFSHPITQEPLEFETDLPSNMETLISLLRENAKKGEAK